MRKPECKVEAFETFGSPIMDPIIVIKRMGCGEHKSFNRKLLNANRQRLSDKDVPECTCPLIPDDVEMSVC